MIAIGKTLFCEGANTINKQKNRNFERRLDKTCLNLTLNQQEIKSPFQECFVDDSFRYTRVTQKTIPGKSIFNFNVVSVVGRDEGKVPK